MNHFSFSPSKLPVSAVASFSVSLSHVSEIVMPVGHKRNILRAWLLLLLATIFHFTLIAQEAMPGSIMTIEGATIRGFIQDGTDAELATGITFSETMSSEGVKYLPTTITSFTFDYGKTFKRFYIVRNDGKDSTAVFAKKRLEGKINLYTFSKKKQNEPDIFLVNNNTVQTVYLKEPGKIERVDENGRTKSYESYHHIGALKAIKGGSSNAERDKAFKYHEKIITKDILKYNEKFENAYPLSIYQPQVKYRFSISAGIPFLSFVDTDVAFRAAVYAHKYNPEKIRMVSIIRGISYRYSHVNASVDPSVQNSSQNVRQQFISLIPFGFNIEGDSKNVRPYLYLGVGVAFLMQTNRNIVDYQDLGNVNEFFLFPTFNVGAGLKIKSGSNFIITEITPTADNRGVCVNVGYSF